MLSRTEILTWLAAANRRYGAEGVPHKGRPFQAMSDSTREHSCSLTMDHPLAKTILDWFYEHSPPGVHQVGSVYTGVHFYDTAFWLTCPLPAYQSKGRKSNPVKLEREFILYP